MVHLIIGWESEKFKFNIMTDRLQANPPPLRSALDAQRLVAR
jgi:hypothetical protein